MKPAYSLLLLVLLTSCGLFRPQDPRNIVVRQPPIKSPTRSVTPVEVGNKIPLIPQGNTQGAWNGGFDSPQMVSENIDENYTPIQLPPMPDNLSPRQQRQWLRQASKAADRVIHAAQPTTPLISVVKVKDRSDNRGSDGGVYKPQAAVATATNGEAVASDSHEKTSSSSWLWWLVIAALVAWGWWERASR